MPSQPLEKYLSNYKGINDWHLQAFLVINKKFSSRKVLYAGSWIHVTPSLVFPYVVYVDLFSKMEKFFTNSELLGYIKKHTQYRTKPRLDFHQSDYQKKFGEKEASFDLLLSLSSGFVSQACASYLKKDGLLLANNEHYDASMAYTDPRFKVIGVFKTPNNLTQSEEEIENYFITTKGTPITLEIVEEDSKRSPSRAKYKLEKNAPLYLFQKISS
jgi:hypothetical protein